ncbi:RDD family protein [Nocardiopsis ansamitocini]|uniref:RDD domain-containing protein n=1 Tax=Nocardiopsis ansamitocini TaxID=1670832 RepID=A0A9W6UHZ4_9ACTN|nr:RDD family protein [Nocardiopsis ansamitocini]GLU49396.1 hypothetical protein Nans01_37470 [Nocardiopsis ansamitocini]
MDDIRRPETGPAPLSSRILARVVDVFVLAGVSIALNSLLLVVLPSEDLLQASFSPASLALSVTTFAVYLGYEVLCVRLYGATPGKLLFGLRLAAASDGTTTAATSSVLKRSVLLYASVLFTPILVVNLIALGLSVYAVISALLNAPSRQGIHDRFGSTLVVRPRLVPAVP